MTTEQRAASPRVLLQILDDHRCRFLLVGGFNVAQGILWFAILYALIGELAARRFASGDYVVFRIKDSES